MVATKKKTNTKTSAVVESHETPMPSLKLKKVKKSKKMPVVADEGTSSSSVVVADASSPKKETVKKQPRVEIDLEVLETKESLDSEEIKTLTVSQLKKLCRTRKIGGYSGKRKEQIMNLLVTVV